MQDKARRDETGTEKDWHEPEQQMTTKKQATTRTCLRTRSSLMTLLAVEMRMMMCPMYLRSCWCKERKEKLMCES